MKQDARTLGVDYGEKRIGLALSDPSGTVATPWQVVPVEASTARTAQRIAELAHEAGVQRIVLGLPLRMDGSAGPAVEAVRRFGAQLEKVCTLPTHYFDERFSTRTAEQALIAGGTRRSRRKQVVDKLAAQILLQHYLDTQAGGLSIPMAEPR